MPSDAKPLYLQRFLAMELLRILRQPETWFDRSSQKSVRTGVYTLPAVADS